MFTKSYTKYHSQKDQVRNLVKKQAKLSDHSKTNPRDLQGLISLYKANSDTQRARQKLKAYESRLKNTTVLADLDEKGKPVGKASQLLNDYLTNGSNSNTWKKTVRKANKFLTKNHGV